MKRAFYPAGLMWLVFDPNNWVANRIGVVLVGPGYVPSPAHRTLLDVPDEAIVAGPALLRERQRDGVELRGANVTLRVGKKGAAYDAVLLFRDTGDEQTSTLLAYLEQTPGTGVAGPMGVRWPKTKPLIQLPDTV